MSKCSVEHIDYRGETCPECALGVDTYGNTEDAFRYCSFPDCGCDGARVCMAGSASDDALAANVEGMWRGSPTREQVVGRMRTYGLSRRRDSEGGSHVER